MSRMQATLISGNRLHLHDGPIDLIIGADGRPQYIAAAYEAARNRFATVLDELCGELAVLRQANAPSPNGKVASRMWQTIHPYRTRCFITPMAAVAGCVAEEILSAMCEAATLHRAYVNNGGDIALHLDGGQSFTLGLVDRPDQPSLFAQAKVTAEDEVRGIATSGWRGRSFSLGIADAVTVLAKTSGAADAAATVIANAVDLPESPKIERRPARDLQPDNDLGEIAVTCGVGPLIISEIETALSRGHAVANRLVTEGLIVAAALHLAGETRVAGSLSARRNLGVLADA